MRRVTILHRTRYSYGAEADVSISETRLVPKDGPGQRVERFRIQTDPPTRLLRHTDGFGTEVVTVFATTPHRRLEVRTSSTVVLTGRQEPPPGEWRALAHTDEAPHWLLATTRTRVPLELASQSTALRAQAQHPRAFVEAVGSWLSERLRYLRGATHVGSDLDHVFGEGAGVCQDFAHAAVGLLRLGGVPARYVSGYLVPNQARSTPDHGGHAWVEVLLDRRHLGNGAAHLKDDETRWWGFDPVHRSWLSDGHIRIGAGRDYDDVAPMRGVYEGSAGQELLVEVEVREE